MYLYKPPLLRRAVEGSGIVVAKRVAAAAGPTRCSPRGEPRLAESRGIFPGLDGSHREPHVPCLQSPRRKAGLLVAVWRAHYQCPNQPRGWLFGHAFLRENAGTQLGCRHTESIRLLGALKTTCQLHLIDSGVAGRGAKWGVGPVLGEEVN